MQSLSAMNTPRLVGAFAICVLLLGRFELALHPYEHDVGELAMECALCEFAIVDNDVLAPAQPAPFPNGRAEQDRSTGARSSFDYGRRSHLPRGPPHLPV